MTTTKPLWAMSFREFLDQSWERRAEVLIESVRSGRSCSWHAYHSARAWLENWKGKYETPAAIEAARGKRGSGWIWGVEWSDRTWRTEIKRALERCEKVPADILREAGLAP